MDLVRFYNKSMAEHVVPFLEALIARIQLEIALCHERGDKNTLIINKCWNIIRVALEYDNVMSMFGGEIELRLQPLFEYIVKPEQIEFEDDMVMVIKTFIKKNRMVTETIWRLFPHLINVFKKNKKTFGNLFDAVNYYLIYGTHRISSTPEFKETLLTMASEALYVKVEGNSIVHNAEGAILYQLIFQVFADARSSGLDDYFDRILSSVFKRFDQEPCGDALKKQLFNTILCAFAYNPVATFSYMESNSLIQ